MPWMMDEVFCIGMGEDGAGMRLNAPDSGDSKILLLNRLLECR